MPYTLKQAAEASGRSKPTILRAIQGGKISAQKDEHGEWQIEPAELHRVYPPVADDDARNDARIDADLEGEPPDNPWALRREVALHEERLAALEAERVRERRMLQETIDDLRRRLDAEAEERRRLTLLLTDRRARPEPGPPGWLRRLFGAR